MTLVHDYQVEELRRKLLEGFVPFLRSCDRLIESQINLVRLLGLVSGQLVHGVSERLEIINPCLIH